MWSSFHDFNCLSPLWNLRQHVFFIRNKTTEHLPSTLLPSRRWATSTYSEFSATLVSLLVKNPCSETQRLLEVLIWHLLAAIECDAMLLYLFLSALGRILDYRFLQFWVTLLLGFVIITMITLLAIKKCPSLLSSKKIPVSPFVLPVSNRC